jgi:non-ribosomal peptide synthetase component F
VWQDLKFAHRVLAKRAQEVPANVAVEYWSSPQKMSERRTFAEMDAHATHMACTLSELPDNPGAEPIVVFFLPKGYQLLCGVIGAMKAHVGVSVVDTKLPLARLRFVLQDTSAIAVVSTSELLQGLDDEGGWRGPKLLLDELAECFGPGPPPSNFAPPRELRDNSLCCVIYTSGSTGNPKGVALQHDSFSNYCAIEQTMTDMRPSDRVLQTQSLSFIAGFHEAWRGILGGGTTVMVSPEVVQLGPDLAYWIDKAKITVFKAVPSLLRTLIGPKKPILPYLRLMHVGGEAVTQVCKHM